MRISDWSSDVCSSDLVSIDKAFVDWSGNCGNLTAAVGSFAISNGLIDAARIPQNGVCVVRIWQTQINKTIVAHVPITNGEVQETGDFELDGVTFPAAEVQIEFLDPRSEEHTSELQSLMRISYAVFCLKKKKKKKITTMNN